MLNQLTLADDSPPVTLLTEDGIFGPKTAAVTRSFERGAQLERDAIVAARERRIWVGAFMTCCGAIKPTISHGSYGD
ncbi:MAG: hypothetical protein QOG54_742 [Actinomycetota bacterium]|jgi:hypothetical protein|nr:hypothetical protein [Actinomycetota bacterium]